MAGIVDFWVNFVKSFLPGFNKSAQGARSTISFPPPSVVVPVTPQIDLVLIKASLVTRPITHIVIHHSLTKDGLMPDTAAIKRYQMSYRINGVIVSEKEYRLRHDATTNHEGFETPDLDIAYNLLIENVNGTVVVQYGRPLTMYGAHTKQQNMNRCSVGICAVGNYDLASPPVTIWERTLAAAKAVQKFFKIPTGNVKPHRFYAGYKSCPGLKWNIEQFCADLDRLV